MAKRSSECCNRLGAAEWTALLSAGYTTQEQRAVGTAQAEPGAAPSGSDTTFF